MALLGLTVAMVAPANLASLVELLFQLVPEFWVVCSQQICSKTYSYLSS
jgi:hypothetical protein